MIEVEKVETASNVEQSQDVQQQVQALLPQSQPQVHQHSEQIKQMYDKVYMEVAEVNFSRSIMWEPVIQQETLQLEQRSVFPLNVHEETDYEDLPELVSEYSEEILGPDIFKIRFLDSMDSFSRAPGGLIIEEFIEPYVTH